VPNANKSSGIGWNEATFEEYIKNPQAKIPGTKMIFPGIKNEQQAKDLWAYVSQFDANGNIKNNLLRGRPFVVGSRGEATINPRELMARRANGRARELVSWPTSRRLV
jgi:hypothetical protein